MEKKIPNGSFFVSAGRFSELPEPSGPEYAVMGRSNVGKSSFINHVLDNRRLARVSGTPGKTILANVYHIDNGQIWVDLPGYGYARKSRSELDRLNRLVRDYCTRRESLSGILWLCDIRHPGMDADRHAGEWFRSIGVPVFTILTKADKVPRGRRDEKAGIFREIFNLDREPLCYSIRSQEARARFWDGFIPWSARIAAGENS